MQAVLKRNRRRILWIRQRSQSFGIEPQVLELALDLFETLLELAVRYGLFDPVRWEICASRSSVSHAPAQNGTTRATSVAGKIMVKG